MALAQAIGVNATAILEYARRKGTAPPGSLFAAYHGFDGQTLDVEIGFPFQPGIEGEENIKVSQIPGGKTAEYHHLGPYEKLPESGLR